MDNLFKLKENKTTVSREIVAGITTFFAMSYIIFVNPAMLSQTGMPFGAVFLATIISSAVSTLIMALFANVPYALAPGMGLNAMFTFTVVFGLGYTWQEALSMVFICGILNIVLTVTKARQLIIRAIPKSLQHAIGGGIGVFIAYIGVKNAGLLTFTSDPGKHIEVGSGTIVADSSIVPELVKFTKSAEILALIGILLTIILIILKVKGAIIIGIVATTLVGIPMQVVDLNALKEAQSFTAAFEQLGQTFGVIFTKEGIPSLFSDLTKLPVVLMAIFAFSLSDIFDTIGTFIGTGLRSGIFTEEESRAATTQSSGFKTKMDKALFADSIGTGIGAILGTSNTTTYVESAAGIEAGGRTGLTSVVTALMFLVSMFFSPLAGIVPAQATAPALIVVGVMMLSAFAEIDWTDIETAVPCFFAGIFMALCYNISFGIAAAFITYVLVKILTKKFKEIHPVLLVSTLLFILNFVVLAIAERM